MVSESDKTGSRPFVFLPTKTTTVIGPLLPVVSPPATVQCKQPLTLDEKDCQQYSRYLFNFSDVMFASNSMTPGTLLLEDIQNASKYLSQFDNNDVNSVRTVPADQRARFDQMAIGLGFKNFKTLQYQCRNLPMPIINSIFQKLEQTISKLGPGERTPANIQHQANAIFFSTISENIQQLFARNSVPNNQQPRFLVRTQGKEHPVNPNDPKDLQQWSPMAMMGAYNAFCEVAGQSEAMFKQLAKNNGQGPLSLIREEKHQNLSQFAGPDNKLNLLEILTGAMQVSYKQGGALVLQDGAISMSARSVIRPEIQKQLALINTPGLTSLEQNEAVKGLQQLLNQSRPGHEIPVTGIYDTTTKNAIKQFKTDQMLVQLQETLEDDDKLNPAKNLKWMKALNKLQAEIRVGQSLGAQAELLDILKQIKDESGSLSPSTISRLKDLEKTLSQPVNDKFDEQTVSYLIDNWFDIMDTGGGMNFTEQVMVHEMGHVLQDMPDLMKNWEQISWKQGYNSSAKILTTETAPSEAMGSTLKHKPNDACCMRGFTSAYARTNASEDFAESFRAFTYQPKRLMQDSLIKFLFLNGLTKTYGDEQLLSMAKEVGFSTRQLQQAIGSIRGNLDDILQKQREENVSAFSQKAAQLSQMTGNPLLGMVAAGAEWFKAPISEGARMVKAWFAGDYDSGIQLDPKFATTNPNIDKLLGVDLKTMRTPPHEPGFVLEFLSSRQALLAGPNSTTAQKEKASQEIEQFIQKGLGVFDAALQAKFPPEIKTLLATATTPADQTKVQANRAVLVALAKILGAGRAHGEWTQVKSTRPEAAAKIKELDAFLNDMKKAAAPEKLKSLIGSKIFDLLPTTFKVMLADPPFIEWITGYRGETTIGSSNITQSVFSEIAKRETKADPDYMEILKSELSDAVTRWWDSLATIENADSNPPTPKLDDRILRDSYQSYLELVAAYNASHLEDSYKPMTLQDFAKTLTEVRLRNQNPGLTEVPIEQQADSKYMRGPMPDAFDEKLLDQMFKQKGIGPINISKGRAFRDQSEALA